MEKGKIGPVCAIILAGGKSSRMGRDKALITVSKVPLLQQICHLATENASQVYVVTPWPEKYQNILPKGAEPLQEVEILPRGVSIVGDGTKTGTDSTEITNSSLRSGAGKWSNIQTQGPLIAFFQGLVKVKTEWVLLLACDLPLLNSSEVEKWISYLPNVGEDAIACLPRSRLGWEPLSGFYRIRSLPLLEDFIARGGKSFQKWLALHIVEELPVTHSRLLFNCNTPADLEKISRLRGLGRGMVMNDE